MKTLFKIALKVLIVWIAISVISVNGKSIKHHLKLGIGETKEMVEEVKKEVPAVDMEVVAQHATDMMPDEIILEKSNDPYDVLYGVNQEEGVYRPAETIFGGLGILVESFNEHFKGE